MVTMTPTAFGQYMRECRVKSGKTLRAVAADLGLSHCTIIDVEQGRRPSLPSRHWLGLVSSIGADIDTLRRLAEPVTIRDLRAENARLRARLETIASMVGP